MSVNGTQVEDKMLRFKGECGQFSFNRCPVYTHDGASAKSSTNSQETDNSVGNPSTRQRSCAIKAVPPTQREGIQREK